MVACGLRGDGFPGLVPEQDEPRGVVLTHHELGEHGGQNAAVVELVRRPLAEIHRRAGVEEDLATQVGVILELLDVILVGAAPDFPINVTQAVPLGVGPVSGKLAAVAEEGTAVQAVEEPLHDRPREERQVVNRGQSARVYVKGRSHGPQCSLIDPV
jgi:hypothetical protein